AIKTAALLCAISNTMVFVNKLKNSLRIFFPANGDAATINCNSNINYMPARATSTELRLANSCMAPDEFLGRLMVVRSGERFGSMRLSSVSHVPPVRPLKKGTSNMHHSPLLAAALSLFLLSVPSTQSWAQTAGPATAAQPTPLGLACDGAPIFDPFKGPLAGANLPPGSLPISDEDRFKILNSGLPCKENVRTKEQGDSTGKESNGLANLQRGFDFYSWRTFVALNKPTDGTSIDQAQADKPTLWEDLDSFKQLLDVMLPANQQPPTWPTDRAGMEAERERLVPSECRDQDRQNPKARIVKMIEESFNEPFKTGPLIDQQGHYAIFDILMNRQMFDYITLNHLNTKAGQAANADLAVDFPAGCQTSTDRS